MGAFLGCCVIAATIWYVGKKIARVLVAIGVMIETIGQRTVDQWPTPREWEKISRDI